MPRPLPLLALSGLLLAGCAARGTPPPRVAIDTATRHGWEGLATADDQARIAALPTTWAAAKAAVGRRAARRMAAEGALLDPAAALDLPTPTPGTYWCRLVRIGGRAGYATFAPDYCYVDGDGAGVSFTKQTGQNLPGGWLYAANERRQVFLGTFRATASAEQPAYSTDPGRDVAGVVERVAPFRWRLVLTRAGKGALLDVYELIPAVPPGVGAVASVGR